MSSAKSRYHHSKFHLAALLFGMSFLTGCSALLPAKVAPPDIYSLDDNLSVSPSPATPVLGAPSVVISTPHAAAGFDSTHMMYVRQAHQPEYFRQSQWINTPAAMLSPLVVAALERNGSFGTVVQSPTSALSMFRLDLEVLRLQQEFFTTPSRAHVTLRAHLIDTTTHQVIAMREFDASVAAPSDNPYGGVVAMNQAVRAVLDALAAFCSSAVIK